MSEGERYSLRDADIGDYLRTNSNFFRDAMSHADSLMERTKDAADSDEVAVPVESLRMMRQAMVAMSKTINDTTLPVEESLFNGDKGANCDYNPFRKINI
ncbi:hypothetical protein [Pseudonocardia asaccharolytica]|uniref:Uncharacterized protein n=1 Tax=Pseudonocardia asaccharolytica DSM 44247 = NBRC 16224 TaxID=1123024 RepID=A0A511D7W4_9PSEU|nr:hypothetical protein [Pseudonocardia asaccharolytica]GEL20895.1 hypothetical protein PA7_47320 [Pseudonocardia asaccharolytica DSM 44247 = NBRC 16224]